MISLQNYKEIVPNGTQSVKDHIASEPHPRKADLLKYLKQHGTGIVAAMVAKDAIDGKSVIGSIQDHEDDKYYWRTEVIYYFDKYNLQLPDDFIAHALRS